MPYNKGDFTQQGVNGDVSALVRLNEKRVMKVVLSSDDESDNCDISGKVYDLLNGTSYDIGSGGGGGGGENVHYCTVKIVNNTTEDVGIFDALDTITLLNNMYIEGAYPPDIVRGTNETFVLAGQHYYIEPMGEDPYDLYVAGYLLTGVVSDMINCTIDSDNNDAIVFTDYTENCSLTITLEE